MEAKVVRTFIKATIVIWSLAFVGGFITGKSAFATQPYNVEVRDHQKTVIKRTPPLPCSGSIYPWLLFDKVVS